MDSAKLLSLIQAAQDMRARGLRPTHYYSGPQGFSGCKGFIVAREARSGRNADFMVMITFSNGAARLWSGMECNFTRTRPAILAFMEGGF